MSKTIKIMPTQVKRTDGTWLGGDSFGFGGSDVTDEHIKEVAETERIKADVAELSDELNALNGIRTLLPAEHGYYYVSGTSLAHADNTARITNKTPIALYKGDEVSIIDSQQGNYKYGMTYTPDDGVTWVWIPFATNATVINEDGLYYICLSNHPTAVTIEDIDTVARYIVIKSAANKVATESYVDVKVDVLNARMDALDGVFERPEYEIGWAYIDSNGNIVNNSNKTAIRPIGNTLIKMKQGDAIRFAKSNTYKLRGGVLEDNGLFTAIAWTSNDYVAPKDGEYLISFGLTSSTTITDAIMAEILDNVTFDISVDSVKSRVNEIENRIMGIAPCYAFSAHAIKGINHRGFNTVAPENTLSAFKESARHGFSFVETDIRFTSDGVPVLLHDATIDRTSNGSGNISSMTYATARTYDFGSWKSSSYAGEKIPTLEEFLVLCRRAQIFPYLELSAEYTIDQLKQLVSLVRKYGMERHVTWCSFYPRNLQNMVMIDGGARLQYMPAASPTQADCNMLKKMQNGMNEVYFAVNVDYATNAIALAKANGIKIELWIINAEAAMLALDEYVSGVTSDSINFETVLKNSLLN